MRKDWRKHPSDRPALLPLPVIAPLDVEVDFHRKISALAAEAAMNRLNAAEQVGETRAVLRALVRAVRADDDRLIRAALAAADELLSREPRR